MKLQDLLLNPFALRVADYLTRQQVMQWYEFYNKAQWWSRDKLLKYQSDHLCHLVYTAHKEVPFYRELYADHGVNIPHIRHVDDLHLLPSISKHQLKVNYPENCTRKTSWPVKEYFTSGSSGNPFAVMVDNQTISQARALMLLRANYSGWKPGEAVFQTGMTLKRGVVKRIKDMLYNVYYASAFDLRDECLDYYLKVIKSKQIKYLMGYPGSIYALANRAMTKDANLKMKGIVTWGDNLYDHFRKEIENQFECRVTDTYGCGEGIQIAAQCPDGYGKYHIFMPHVIVEIVNDTGEPVSRGQSGNVLLTRLIPGAMPLIRYRVGDIGRLCVEKNCLCGRGYDVLDKIEGRDSDIIHTPGGNKLIVHFFTGIFEYYPDIENFKVYQYKIDELHIKIVFNSTVNSNFIINNIKKEILEKGDSKLNIEFTVVNFIDNDNTGKRRFVISHVKR